MSIRIIEDSLSNNNFDNSLANCVLPTPVGPKKINEPIGLFGSFNPTRFRCIAFTIFATASSCPITLPFSWSAIKDSFAVSFSATRLTGIPVIIAITSATF